MFLLMSRQTAPVDNKYILIFTYCIYDSIENIGRFQYLMTHDIYIQHMYI